MLKFFRVHMVIDKVHTITDKVSQEVVQIRATANTAFFFEILVSRLGDNSVHLLNSTRFCSTRALQAICPGKNVTRESVFVILWARDLPVQPALPLSWFSGCVKTYITPEVRLQPHWFNFLTATWSACRFFSLDDGSFFTWWPVFSLTELFIFSSLFSSSNGTFVLSLPYLQTCPKMQTSVSDLC